MKSWIELQATCKLLHHQMPYRPSNSIPYVRNSFGYFSLIRKQMRLLLQSIQLNDITTLLHRATHLASSSHSLRVDRVVFEDRMEWSGGEERDSFEK